MGHGLEASYHGFPNVSWFFRDVTTIRVFDDSLGQRTKIHQDSMETAFLAREGRGKPRARHIPLGKVFHFATTAPPGGGGGAQSFRFWAHKEMFCRI